jgi:hypothetical protein
MNADPKPKRIRKPKTDEQKAKNRAASRRYAAAKREATKTGVPIAAPRKRGPEFGDPINIWITRAWR